jgi:hypothetical protein
VQKIALAFECVRPGVRVRGLRVYGTEELLTNWVDTDFERLTIYPLTLFSSTANVFMASCILSKLVDFQTKSAEKLWVHSDGTPSVLLNSNPISSETSIKLH